MSELDESGAQVLRPHITVVLAMSADGKIADYTGAPARFGSPGDRHHLETQIAQADATLFGANTLRAYGTTLPITDPALLAQRRDRGQPPQPIHMVCSRSGQLDPRLRFFQQPVPRWLVTTPPGAAQWSTSAAFDRVLASSTSTGAIAWPTVWTMLRSQGVERLVAMGGGTVVGLLLAHDWVDEVWLTLCPLLLGGAAAPTLLAHTQFTEQLAPRLRLHSVRSHNDEVFLHYHVVRP